MSTTTTTTTVEQTDTATTTTEAPETTTTTTETPETTTTTTVEKQGEVEVDKSADAKVLGDATPGEEAQAKVDNIESAKRDALANHEADHADDHRKGRSQPTEVPED